MDLKKIRIFADVAETGNFTKSGDRLGYTQSAISHSLKSLENEIGFSLFTRSRNGVQLTDDAKKLLPIVNEILGMYETLENKIFEINKVETGSITIATFQSVSVHWLPPIMKKFKEEYPGIKIKLLEGGTDEIVDWIYNDVADFGFLSDRGIRSLDWIHLKEDPLVAIFPNDDKHKAGEKVAIEEFQDASFIMISKGKDYDVRAVLSEAEVSPDVRFATKDDYTVISMVSNHLGSAIMPGLVVKGFEDRVKILPLEPSATRQLGIAMKSVDKISPAAAKFIKLTKEMIPELER